MCGAVQFFRMQFYLCVFRLTPVEKLGAEVPWPEEGEHDGAAGEGSGDVLAFPVHYLRDFLRCAILSQIVTYIYYEIIWKFFFLSYVKQDSKHKAWSSLFDLNDAALGSWHSIW